MNTSRSDMTVSVHILESWDESPFAKDRIQTGLTPKKTSILQITALLLERSFAAFVVQATLH